jgi:signal transduction histidine kinase
MIADDITRKKTKSPETLDSNDRNDIEQFRHLSYDLLKYSTQGLLRKDFLPRVTERIRSHSGCDAAEIWVKEESDKHFRCLVTRSKKNPSSLNLMPYPLGNEENTSLEDPANTFMEHLSCSVIRGTVDRLSPHVTELGSFWADTAVDEMNRDGSEDATGPYNSNVIIPVRFDEECIGLLKLMSSNKGYFSRRDVDFYEDISTILGAALSHQYTHIELRERIKEITCLYEIARVVAKRRASFAEIIRGVANLLPPAWLHPEITCARIVLDGKSYKTEGFRESPYRQVSDIIVNNEKVGFVEVAYLEKKFTIDEGPFLFEERSLIDSVAREVAIFYERTRAEAERVSLQEQLRHADRLATIGQLAAGVAHELNEPLGNILGFAQLAKKSPDLPEQVAKDLKNIESASLNAREIIKKLLTFARQLPPKKVPVNINDIIIESTNFFESRCTKNGIRLTQHLADDLSRITVDPGQINQMFVNLMVNAIQAMPEGGTLTVRTQLTREGICLSVEDTGIGMTEETRKKVFLPFFTTKDINEGTGLGLAMVHGIITSHGGKILVESEMGKGTRFLVHLPMTYPEKPEERQT